MGRMTAEVYLALVHSPIYNKHGDEITTTVTNLDLHDICRAGKTYDINKYFIVNHLKSQQKLVKRMRAYWVDGFGSDYNSNRKQAFLLLEVVDNLKKVRDIIKEETGKQPRLIATDARDFSGAVSYKQMRQIIVESSHPFIIVLGTGWGLTKETIADCDYFLEPIYGRGEFNHLSVRSAASIILDRLLAAEWWQ